MYRYLDKVEKPSDIKTFSDSELCELSREIREFLIKSVSVTGGHLASNLGIVELTLALYKAFDLPKDKIVWDVGHQTYVHKILTGRRDRFSTLRKFGGLSGFPKTSESKYDAFNTGHSSTSISAAFGMANANMLADREGHVVAVIGDGALTGGMAYEALNAAGLCKKNFIVVLNDNEMSISKNIGSVSNHLTKIRTRPLYFKFKAELELGFRRIPVIGLPILKLLKHIKDSLRHFFTKSTIFEDLGFAYLGPIDGHDIETLAYVLESAKSIKAPVLVHAVTKKGKGYELAETMPTKYHGISAETKDCIKPDNNNDPRSYSEVFGKTLIKLAKDDERICAITAAMPDGTGLCDFSRYYPNRFFDVAIAEAHAVTFAAGLSVGGYKPVFAVYSSFLQRAYDQIFHDVCLQGLDFVFCVDRAGLVGGDGETHQGIFDIAYLSHLPNMTLLAPCNFSELEQMLTYAVKEHKGPIAIRYPRTSNQLIYGNPSPFKMNKTDIVYHGTDVAIIFVGNMGQASVNARDILKQKDIDAAVINLRTVMPLDKEHMVCLLHKYKVIAVVEDGICRGGAGEYISSILNEYSLNIRVILKAHKIGLVQHGSVEELYKLCGLDAKSIAKDIIEELEKKHEQI